MGVPLTVVDKGYANDFPKKPTPSKSKPRRLFDYNPKETSKPEKIKTDAKDNYDTGSSQNDDDDDIDWL